jgi:hypothetical protein
MLTRARNLCLSWAIWNQSKISHSRHVSMLSCHLHTRLLNVLLSSGFSNQNSTFIFFFFFWIASSQFICSINVSYSTERINENVDPHLYFLPTRVIWPARLIFPYLITLAVFSTEYKSWRFLGRNLLQPPDTSHPLNENSLLKHPQSMFLTRLKQNKFNMHTIRMFI